MRCRSAVRRRGSSGPDTPKGRWLPQATRWEILLPTRELFSSPRRVRGEVGLRSNPGEGPSREPEPTRIPTFSPQAGRRREFFPLGVAFSTQRLERQPGKLTRPVRRASGAIGMKRILIVAAASAYCRKPGIGRRSSFAHRTGSGLYPVAAVYDWGGGYVGVNAGYAFGQSVVSANDVVKLNENLIRFGVNFKFGH